ncbi:MAG: hypothetical protein RJA70_3404 [Pseudomonadota bacterium]
MRRRVRACVSVNSRDPPKIARDCSKSYSNATRNVLIHWCARSVVDTVKHESRIAPAKPNETLCTNARRRVSVAAYNNAGQSKRSSWVQWSTVRRTRQSTTKRTRRNLRTPKRHYLRIARHLTSPAKRSAGHCSFSPARSLRKASLQETRMRRVVMGSWASVSAFNTRCQGALRSRRTRALAARGGQSAM